MIEDHHNAYHVAGCRWRRGAPTADVAVGDVVTLCTAQRLWTVVRINGDHADLTPTVSDKWLQDLPGVHVSHLDLDAGAHQLGLDLENP